MAPDDHHQGVVDLAFATTGSGTSVLFVHGLDDDRSAWDETITLLPELRCVTVDLPGHGESPAPPDPTVYEREPVLRSLDRVIAATEASVLVGHSLGGYLGLAHAITRPGILRSLVLVAGGPGFRDESSRARWNDRVRANASSYGIPEQAATIGLHVDAMVIDGLASVNVPVALVVGSRDKAFVGAADYLERRLVNTRRATVEGAGHFVMRSDPAAVADAVRWAVDEAT